MGNDYSQAAAQEVRKPEVTSKELGEALARNAGNFPNFFPEERESASERAYRNMMYHFAVWGPRGIAF